MAKDKQLSTDLNVDPYEELDEIYRQAIDMRLQNFAYADIGKHVDRKEQTVRTWFMKEGICYEAYEYRRDQVADERKERFIEIEEQLREMAADSIIVVKSRLRKGSETAAFKVLEMVGYGSVLKLKHLDEDSEELKILRQLVDDGEKSSQPVSAEQSGD